MGDRREDILEAVRATELEDERVATDVAAVIAASEAPPSEEELREVLGEAIDRGRTATVRTLFGCGARLAPDSLHRAAAIEDPAVAVATIAMLVQAGARLDERFDSATPLQLAATVEAALLLAREGAPVASDICASHAMAGRVEIADALAAGVPRKPSITVRPVEHQRHYWAHAALASLRKVPGSAEGVRLRRESERLVSISGQLSSRLREKGAECDRLVQENEKLQRQLVDAGCDKDKTVYMDAAETSHSEEIAAQNITIAALRDELEELRARADEDVLNVSAVKDSAAAEADAAARKKIEALSAEVTQLQAAAADAVAQLHRASEAVVEQRERARRADSALAEVEKAHRQTKAELGEARGAMDALRDENERQVRELEQLASAVRDLETRHQQAPSSPATKETTPPRETTMLARARTELPPSTRPKLLQVLQSIDHDATGWLDVREFQFGLQMAGCVSFNPDAVDKLAQELKETEDGHASNDQRVSITHFMDALSEKSAPATPTHQTDKTSRAAESLADTCLRTLLDYTAQTKTTVKMYLLRYTGGSGDSAGELRVDQLQAALRSAGLPLEAWQIKHLMGELLVLCGSCTKVVGSSSLNTRLEKITIGRVLDGVKQWRRQQALAHNGTPPQSGRKSASGRIRAGWNGTPASTTRRAHGSATKLRLASPNASSALFAQLEELTAECESKDTHIKRLTEKLTAATAAADSTVIDHAGSLTPELVQSMIADAVKAMDRKEEHLHDELDALERKLASAQQQADACREKLATQQQTPDGVAAQILEDAAKTVENAEAELAGYKADYTRQMEQVSNLNDELNREAKKLRSALDHAFKERDKLNAGHKSAMARLQAENRSLKSRIDNISGGKQKDAEVSDLRSQLKAKERTLEEQEVALEESRAALAKAKKAASTFRERANSQQTSKVHQQLSEAERRIVELSESEASLKKLLDARQRGLSHAVERVTRQEKELSAARAALQTKTGRASQSRLDTDAHRDNWLGEGRALAVGDQVAVLAEHGDDNQDERFGKVVFLGSTELGDGAWAGVSLDQPLGKHDGRVRGRRYFDCKENHGVLVRPSKLRRISDAMGLDRRQLDDIEEDSNQALVDGIVALQGWLRDAEDGAQRAIMEAEVSKKARRQAEKQYQDTVASLQQAKTEK
jgi:DNA repair exonuclease SbcCD ATPase subunit